MPPQSTPEERILDLCQRVIALPEGSKEFEPTIRELKVAIHQQLQEARANVAKMALIVAARNNSQAAD